jgi:hypothetical protein
MNRIDAAKLLNSISDYKQIDYYETLELVDNICIEYEESLKILQYNLDCQESIIKELMEYKFMYEGLSK